MSVPQKLKNSPTLSFLPRRNSQKKLASDGIHDNGVMPTDLTPTGTMDALSLTWTSPRGMKIDIIGSKTAFEVSRKQEEADEDTTHDPNGNEKVLRVETMNQAVVEMKYDVRGMVPSVAEVIQSQIRDGNGPKRPYDKVLFCNIGNPQACGQKPISFFREVLALSDCPWLLEDPRTPGLFAPDAIARARELVGYMGGGTGCYSHSQGVRSIRQRVAKFIENRDGYPADVDSIFLANGASAAIQMVLTALISGPQDGILIPIPQYPIYSALIALLRGHRIGYDLVEENNWGFDVRAMKKTCEEARRWGISPKALVVINPGNPVGSVLAYEELKRLVVFCKEEGLMLMADEVYQENIYCSKPFVSLKKVVRDLGPEYDDFELVSFHSTSKGMIGECGRRGGYMEMCGVDPKVQSHVLKLASSQLCSNLNGQLMCDLMLNEPRPGEASYAKWKEEKDALYGALKRKSIMMHRKLNAIEGISCNELEGAMYAFPRIDMPQGAIEAAEAAGHPVDTFYALSLLEQTGLCVVPGNGFGQKEGTYHVRITFLPQEAELEKALDRFEAHHYAFVKEFSEYSPRADE